MTDSVPIAHRGPKIRTAAISCKKVTAKKPPPTHSPLKNTVPSTLPGENTPVRKAPEKTKPAALTAMSRQKVQAFEKKPVLKTWKKLVENKDNQNAIHLVNKWDKINNDAKPYIQNGGSTKSAAAAIQEPKYFDLDMGTSLPNIEFFAGGSQL
ncbi:hypothetical protein BDK51DRAFT_28223 [Blyttiomyces helicus]|uniref:Uncharacterized protein n=1 Tax=Blyttiomyces helicus TaxID=388810 RepID=A0A4P9WHA5_9FUNG|nr:hypothetical protein BDK51DRAFT_28223 [Blyttiomyces helicus]|eukprot:RKO92211.1 hypothetical protein BDK51DRAFT_28223 [Blyttiomyces helicus]